MKKTLLICLLAATTSAFNSFEGHKVFKVTPTTVDQTHFLKILEQENNTLDFWTTVKNVGVPVDIMVKPEEQKEFVEKMIENGILTETMIDDVQELINIDTANLRSRNGMNWEKYHTLEEIYSWMDQLALDNSNVSIISPGKTHEGRDIKGVKLSFKSGNRGVFIEGGIHAREWISPATVTYLINELIENKDPDFTKVFHSFDWYIFPSVNPDGYSYSHTTNRLWRKTRKPYGLCYGADANRNWASHWGENGTSTSSCSETYGGPSAFSEVETSRMAAFIWTIGPSLDVFLSFHSYSQYLLIPYGHTTAPLDNFEDVMNIGLAANASLATRYGTQYTVGNTAEILYPASGFSADWVKQVFKTPIVFTYELRDTGKFGFLLPVDQIVPNCEEVMDSLAALFTEGEKLGYLNLGK